MTPQLINPSPICDGLKANERDETLLALFANIPRLSRQSKAVR
jgi:hypothetical protein